MAKTVLVVDDAAFMRMMIKNFLEGSDYKVVAEA
ncbi:MAG: two-component system response regulator, partial [Bacillota bacterium]